MSKLIKLYRENIYGVMGTLVFHILLTVSLILADMSVKGEEEFTFISIEREEDYVFSHEPDDVSSFQQEPESKETISRFTETPGSTPVSNRAVNDASRGKATRTDPFFDEEYQKEIEDAKKLVSNVNRQLAKNISETNDFADKSLANGQSVGSHSSGIPQGSRASSGRQIEMPEQTTEGMNPDEISNTIYSGKSNIHYSLENRYHLRLPIPVYLTQGGGKITINIWVSRDGKVTKTEVQPGSQLSDPMITDYALQAASRTVFNTDATAPNPQKGTITYTFVPQ